jgi:aryl-alcohol dehydrogenase-like predicted oxidoreductase
LGRTGLRVSAIGLGAWQFGAREWGWGTEYARDDAIAAIHRALDLGVNLVDTAEIYGAGRSERIIGEVLKKRREEIVLATKVSPWHLHSSQVVRAANRSLQRLGTDCIDLYQVHFPNPIMPIQTTMKGMSRLVTEGKVRHVGVSNFSATQLQAAQDALSNSEIVSNQVKYNLLQRKIEKDLRWYERENISIIAYSPLAQGLLTGKYGPDNPPAAGVRTANRLFSRRNLRTVRRILDSLKEIAEVNRRTVTQVSLNWLIKNPLVIAIPGAKRSQQVNENVGGAGWRLNEADIMEIDRLTRDFRPDTVLSLLTIPIRLLVSRLPTGR